MAVKYVEVRPGVWKPSNWKAPKRVIDSKRLGEVIRQLSNRNNTQVESETFERDKTPSHARK